jgi:hypothetical protein
MDSILSFEREHLKGNLCQQETVCRSARDAGESGRSVATTTEVEYLQHETKLPLWESRVKIAGPDRFVRVSYRSRRLREGGCVKRLQNVA